MKHLILIASIVLSMVSCTKAFREEAKQESKVAISTTKSENTLMNAPTGERHYFDVGDQVGIYINTTDNSGGDLQPYVVNREAITEAQGGLLLNPYISYVNGRKLNIHGYYPYRPGGAVNDEFEIVTEVNQFSLESYKAMDFMAAMVSGVEMGTKNIDLLFQHKNSKIDISIEKGDGIYDWATVVNPVVRLNGVPAKSVYNFVDDVITADFSETVDNIIPAGLMVLNKETDKLEGISVILPPKTNNDAAYSIDIEYGNDGNRITHVAVVDEELLSGYAYSYNLKLSRSGVVPTVSIKKWEQGPGQSIESQLWATSKFKFKLAADVVGKQIGDKVIFITTDALNSKELSRSASKSASGDFSLVTPIEFGKIVRVQFLGDTPFEAVMTNLSINDKPQEVEIANAMIK